jgi:hypothetical protein
MSRQTTVIVTCDRCEKVYTPEPTDGAVVYALILFRYPPAVEDVAPPRLLVEPNGARTVDFADLCPKCSNRVDNLIAQIRLDKEPNGEAPVDE